MTFRFQALEDVLSREPYNTEPPSSKISDYYSEDVFDEAAMKEYLPEEAYVGIKEATEGGKRIDRRTANLVASAMKAWATGKGVTHYTHWFQPLTGMTAEKHDAFFEPGTGNNMAIEIFEGSQLVQQEPDASSFPSGGIRNTFEARGYTAWDPSSPAFIIGRTLCIPTIFISYTGEALDYKMPLLKALHAVDQAAVNVCRYFDRNVKKVNATLGWEQEYFLIDKALFNARPDLVLTGRTLFGHSPAKGQQLEDHYFGSIPERAAAFMRDLEASCYSLGIPVRTRHNEVAPNQFECAPIYEEANLAVDHNQLLMDLMEKIARKHDFRVLLHEKPFAGVNGSGKHNNWSLATDTGVNLLSPGKTPKSNLQFLTFVVNTVKAVHKYNDLLRASIASAGNDHRLGANEAPPAIISIFIGKQLTKMLDEIERKVTKGKMSPDLKTELKLNLGKIPEILLDNTDRNRTSPFAFTGNKFEFRAPGSSSNCSRAMITINTIVAQQLVDFKADVDKIIEKGDKKDEAILKVLRKYIVESKAIRFEGDGYSDEWVKEAEKRGLSNIRTTPEALRGNLSSLSRKIFENQQVMTSRELEARNEIALDHYVKEIQIESRTMGDLAMNHVLPTAIRYQNILNENVRGLKDSLGKDSGEASEVQIEMIRSISKHISAIKNNVEEMIEQRKRINKIEDSNKKASEYCEKVIPYFGKIRRSVDKLELTIDDEYWPLPKYRELLFTR